MPDRGAIFQQWLDVVTVILISLAAIGTAWCSYQGARWSAVQSFNYAKANELRTQSAQWAARANAHRTVDVLLFVEYEGALKRDPGFAQFLHSRFEPVLRTAVDAWLQTDPLRNRAAPNAPFTMREYRLVEEAKAAGYAATSDALLREGTRAQERSDNYIFLTVLFATVSFLGGIALKLRRPMDFIVTVLGCAALVSALIVTLTYRVR